jgi:DNA-binding transcriptional MerR regulator
MRIGELSAKTGVPSRMLRYYEEQDLITPRRLDNGYRVYDDHLVDRVHKIRGLIDSGIPTRIVACILPCLSHPQSIVAQNADPGLFDLLEEERDRMTEKIDFLTQNRDAITNYLAALERAATRPVDATKAG